MTKQEQIEEMANIPHKCIKSSCEECIKNDRKCADYTRAEALYNAGYRKADEVRKETAREILREIRGYYPVDLEHCDKGEAFILELCYELANKYDVKVKE